MALKERLADVPVLGTALRLQARYREDAADQFAAAIGFFGFLSVFPLLILALATAGFVLVDRPADDIVAVADAIQAAIPGFTAALGDGSGGGGTQIRDVIQGIIDNRGSIGLIGLATLLFAGMKVTNAAQTAALVVFRVDILEQKAWRLRLWQLVALVVLGLLALLGVGASSAVGAVANRDVTGPLALVVPVVGVLVTFALDVVLFATAYRLFGTAAGPTWRQHLPGAVLGATGWTALKVFGATYVSRQVSEASELYGTLGGVFGLLLLLYLAGRLYLYGAELSALRAGIDPRPVGVHPVADGPSRPAAATAAPAAPAGAGGPPPRATTRPRDPGPAVPTPTIGPTTRARLDVADAHRPRRPDVRGALALLIALGAVGGLVAATRPWDQQG